MPVWHEATRELREAGELKVIGLTQEQHPDRCRLYAQWQEFNWPILWDPFNASGATAVPNVFAIDEYGIVRATRLRPDRLKAEFLDKEFAKPKKVPAFEPLVERRFLEKARGVGADRAALARMLWTGQDAHDDDVRALEKHAMGNGAAPIDFFRLGVAYRLRYDSDHRRSSDFQASIDAWSEALDRDPNQYIWRRRLQQYGPRLDKPYPFYDWVARAQDEVRARGLEPVAVRAHLTESELAGPAKSLASSSADEEEPDAEGRIHRDKDGYVVIETAIAPHTGGGRGQSGARVHIVLRPDPKRGVHWTNDAGPATIWIDPPDGWTPERRRFDLTASGTETSDEVRYLDFEIGGDGEDEVLTGYALYYVCEGEHGECVYRRADFEIPLR